jgi:WD40 repeat protein
MVIIATSQQALQTLRFAFNTLVIPMTAISQVSVSKSLVVLDISTHMLEDTDIPVPASNFIQVYRGHLEAITDIAWQPGAEKELIASASSDGNILVRL